VLVNCAGIGVAKRVVGREGPHSLTDFDRVIRIVLAPRRSGTEYRQNG